MHGEGVVDDRVALLRGLPTLRGYSDAELAALAELVEELEVPAGTMLTREDAPATHAYVLVDGRVTVTLRGEHIATLGPGQFVGEMAMLDHGPRSATVVAETPLRLLALGPEAFAAFVNRGGANKLAEDLVGRLRATGSLAADAKARTRRTRRRPDDN